MNRREFLKVTAKGGALAAASPLVLDFLKRSDAFPATVSDSALPGLEASLAKVISKALASGGQYADVYLEEVARTSLSLADGKVNSVNYGIDKGGGVRVLANWKTGYAYCDSWDETALTQVARVASEISRGGGAASSVKLAAEPGRGIVTYQVSPDAVDASRKAEVLTTIDSVARGYDPAIKQVRATFRDELRKITIATSDGTIVRQELPLIWIDVSTLAERGDKRSPGYARRSKKMGFEFADRAMVEDVARDAARQAVDMLEAGNAPSGEMPVVIGSGGGVVFHEAVGHGLEADSVERKASFYAGLMGTKVASDLITLVDEGSIPGLRGSFDFDDEATPSGKNVLIEGGMLRDYMYDLVSARKLKGHLTGNGRRESYLHYPLVRMTNTYIMAGSSVPDEIIAATQRGLYAKRMGGGEVDTATGSFTFSLMEAYLIEKGKITSPVRGATLIGNGPEILKRIDMLGNDLSFWPGTCGKGQWVPITSGAPTLRIASIVVGGRG